MKKITSGILFLGLLLSFVSFSQNGPTVGGLPMMYNGGFAGESNKGRLNVGGTGELPISLGFFASYDQFIAKLGTGVGLTYLMDENVTGVKLSVSPKFSFKGKYTLAPFIDFGHFSDSYPNEISLPESEGDATWKANTGFLFNSINYYVGLSFEVVREGEQGAFRFDLAEGFCPVLQAGYSFQRLPESDFSFTPQLAIGLILDDQFVSFIDISLMVRYKKFVTGLNSDGIAAGYQGKKSKIILSQSYLFGGLTGTPMATITYRYFFNNSNRSRF